MYCPVPAVRHVYYVHPIGVAKSRKERERGEICGAKKMGKDGRG